MNVSTFPAPKHVFCGAEVAMLLWRLFLIVCFTAAQDLAVVRPYASLSEVSSLESSFLLLSFF